MRYFGSKTSTLLDLGRLIAHRHPTGTFCDCFGGIGTVGAHFKKLGYEVVTGDVLRFAHYFQVSRVQSDVLPAFNQLRRHLGIRGVSEICAYLNGLAPADGWLVREYAEARSFLTLENALRIQSCWTAILEWDTLGLLVGPERAVLLASLIDSVDKVANTAGTYYAYLKSFHRKALKKFCFNLLQPSCGTKQCHSFHEDALTQVQRGRYDVLYLDPPYNARVYSEYYHLPETLAHGVEVQVQGKSGKPNAKIASSEFNRRSTALSALRHLLEAADFGLLVFHYADNGLIAPSELRDLFAAYPQVEEHVISSKGYSAHTVRRTTEHRIYLVSNA